MAGPAPAGNDYQTAVATAFNHQGPTQKAAIVAGARANPNTPASQAVLKAAGVTATAQPKGAYQAFRAAIPDGQKTGDTPQFEDAIHSFIANSSMSDRLAIYQGAKANPNLPSSKIALQLLGKPGGGPVINIPAAINHVANVTGQVLHQDMHGGLQKPIAGSTGGGGGFLAPIAAVNGSATGAMFGGVKGAARILANTGKDVVDLPAEAFSSVAVPATDALHGDWAAAADSFVKPFEQAAANPGKFFYQHPLDSYLMATGLAHPIERVADTGVKALGGKGVQVARAPVHITANMNVERPDLSLSAPARAAQKVRDATKFTKNEDGTVKAKRSNTEARLIKVRVSRLVNGGELIRRSDRNTQIAEHMHSVLKNRAGRAVHAVKTALTYNPKAPLIPGAEVLRLIAEGVIRKPGTVAADLEKHLQQVSSTRPDLLDSPADLKTHDKYVKTIQKALTNKQFLANPEPAFKAAIAYRKAMGPLERDAARYGHYKDMSREALQRRAAMPAVLTHMPGARMDEHLGMVQDTPTGPRRLSTQEMRRFVRDQAGRDAAYVPHGAGPGNSAFFVSQSRRPKTAPENTKLFNFTHGLADPSHESMLKNRVKLQGVVNAHRQLNRIAKETEIVQPGGSGWDTFQAAEKARKAFDPEHPERLVPIRRVSFGYPQRSLETALQGTDLATLDEEAQTRGLDYTSRLKDDGTKGPGAWALIDSRVARELKAHENNVNLDPAMRFFRGANNQWRTVALATSFRHLPGVAQENLIRSAASGVGPVSYFAGRQVLRAAKEINPTVGHERQVEFTGGMKTGQALRMQTHGTAQHYEGTMLHAPLAAWEKAAKSPGLRQATSLWHAWGHFMLGGTRKMLEEQSQVAAIGRHTINDFGGRHGLLAVATGQWGRMIDQAAHGILDEQGAQRFMNTMEKIYGRWTNLTPSEQKILMFSPFGTWWLNSAKWIAALPADHPVLSGAMAANNLGTAKQRQKQGMDLFSPGALPAYLQGGVPLGGGKVLQSNYYSPFGIANDPLGTAESLWEPWQMTDALAMLGLDWHGGKITSPTNPTGRMDANVQQRLMVILGSAASSFIPLYTKAQTIVQGGASSFDTSSLLSPQTKGPNPGVLAGIEDAANPVKIGKIPGASTSTGKTAKSTDVSLPSVNLPSIPSINLPSMP